MVKSSTTKTIINLWGTSPFLFTLILTQQQEVLFFFYAKMNVVSYRIIIAFHKDLELPKIAIFRSFDQDWEDLVDLDHFDAIEEKFLLIKRCLML